MYYTWSIVYYKVKNIRGRNKLVLFLNFIFYSINKTIFCSILMSLLQCNVFILKMLISTEVLIYAVKRLRVIFSRTW